MTSTPEPDFELTAADKQSATWRRLRAHLEQELINKRGQNDGALDPIQTAKLRGHIESLKGLIALSDDKPPIDG